ncbi:MAG: YHS domain-containing protein [Calditrichaeota bacterium]|nr:MAG: YHS domain-containing protein [Calditrichota bacterium]MBL1207236.1 YHS domain-containing protein [Calditrichota bacterium]NOG47069.1 YHS domain-containing protein [Calditrichota bacterium]
MAKDLVCGMQVDSKVPVTKSEFKNKVYYFCSELCKEQFDENPQEYINESSKSINDNSEKK